MGKIQEKIATRNKPLKRVKFMFVMMFVSLCSYIIYFNIFLSPDLIMNDYNPRLESIENQIIRGTIYDKNGVALAESKVIGDSVQRLYPFDNAFAHVIGYVDYGKTGIEAYSNIDLLKTNSTLYERMAGGPFTKSLAKGNSVITTLDSSLQLLARDLLGENKGGAIVAIEPSTGKILAMVSTPDYNPNTIETTYSHISTDKDKASLLNRATQGLYPPGSTYKIITTVAHLEHKPEDSFFSTIA